MTIKRPRKRPCMTSCNFRSFWWLVRMEATLRIRYPRQASFGLCAERGFLYREEPDLRWARTERILQLNDTRRYYP